MQNKRVQKKSWKKSSEVMMSGILERMDRQERVLGDIVKKFEDQQEILGLYYKTYQEMKMQNQKKYLLTYIRMRDAMLKDIDCMKARGSVNEEMFRLLSIYIEEYNILLQDNGVEILSCRENEEFKPDIEKPLKRVSVHYADLDNKVVQVYGYGYKWNGIVLKKIQVAIGVYNK